MEEKVDRRSKELKRISGRPSLENHQKFRIVAWITAKEIVYY
jgi:hypothetical protein